MTAVAAERLIHHQLTLLGELQGLLKYPKDPTKAVQRLLQEKGLLRKQLATYEAAQVQAVIHQLRNSFQTINGIHTVIAQVRLPQAAALKQVVAALQKVDKPLFVVLATTVDQKPHLAVGLSAELAQQWPQNAQDIIKKLAAIIQGGGGGSPTFATASGKHMVGLPEVLRQAKSILENMEKVASI